jgi:SPP1 gp7 family putative phage head morphogenesis protein
MKSDEYWSLRALQREAESHDGTKDTLKRLAVMYGDADKELIKMIERIFLNFQKYTGVSEEAARELLSVQETEELMADLRKQYAETGDAEALAKLNAPAYGYRISRLQAARRALEAELDKLAGQEEKAGSRQIVKAYDDSYYKTMYDVLPELPGTPVVPLSQGVVNQAIQNPWKGENYSSRVWKNHDVLASEGGKIIDAGVTAGKSVQQMTAEMSDLMNVGAYAAARLIRTEVNRMHNDAALQSYEAMGLKEYTYLATLDARTCAVCGALDLEVFKVAEAKTGVNLPPMHPNDRCTIAPKIPGTDVGGSRIARDPETGRNYKVPAGMTYEEWRKDISQKYGADSLETAQKKYWNRKTDAAQLNDLKKVIGSDAPKDLAELQNWKYNEPEKWSRAKEFYQYRLENPGANHKDFTMASELKELGIKGKIHIPAKVIDTEKLGFDNGHINTEREHNVTDEEAREFIKQARVSITRWQGQYENYYSEIGAAYVNLLGDYIRTAYLAEQFKGEPEKICEVIKKYAEGNVPPSKPGN